MLKSNRTVLFSPPLPFLLPLPLLLLSSTFPSARYRVVTPWGPFPTCVPPECAVRCQAWGVRVRHLPGEHVASSGGAGTVWHPLPEAQPLLPTDCYQARPGLSGRNVQWSLMRCSFSKKFFFLFFFSIAFTCPPGSDVTAVPVRVEPKELNNGSLFLPAFLFRAFKKASTVSSLAVLSIAVHSLTQRDGNCLLDTTEYF